MFVEEYLLELKSRGYTLPALLDYVVKTSRRSRANVYRNPDAVRSVVINALGFFAFFVVVALAVAFFLDGGLARRFIVFEGIWLSLGTMWLLSHLGLLRNPRGIPLARIGLANQLSVFRLLMIPAIHLFIVEGFVALALLAYALAGISDILDGHVARRFGMESRLGLVLDPIVDVGYIVSIFGALHQVGWIPGWLMALVWLRYGLLFGGTAFLYLIRGRVTIRPTAFGRVSGVLITGLNFLLLALAFMGWLEPGSDINAVLMAGLGFLFAAACVQLVVIGLHNLRGGDSRTVAYNKVVGDLRRPGDRG